jgi:hypothetical protein
MGPVCVLFVALAGPAAGQSAGPAADRALEAARTAFELMPEAERTSLQEDLVWTGDYNAGVGGAFGRRTYEGIVAFETRAKLKVDGMLDAKERVALKAAAAKAREEAGFIIIADPRNGVRIGVAARYTDKSAPTKNGTRFRSGDNAVLLETLAYGEREADLAALFEEMKADAPPARKVTYKLLRPDFFVISGDDKGRHFYTRFAKPPQGAAASGLRGFTFSYPVAMAPQLDRITIAIANSFEPFPGAAATVAAKPPAPASGPSPVPAPKSGSGFIASGLAVAPGLLLTTASVGTCAEPMAGKEKAKILRVDKASGLALLQTGPGGRASAFGGGLHGDPVADGDAVVALGFAEMAGEPSLSVAPGALAAMGDKVRVLAALQRMPAGGAVIDRSGALIGLVAGDAAEPRLVAGVVPQAHYALVGPAEIGTFLQTAGVALGDGPAPSAKTTGAIATAYGPAMVAVLCGR